MTVPEQIDALHERLLNLQAMIPPSTELSEAPQIVLAFTLARMFTLSLNANVHLLAVYRDSLERAQPFTAPGIWAANTQAAARVGDKIDDLLNTFRELVSKFEREVVEAL